MITQIITLNDSPTNAPVEWRRPHQPSFPTPLVPVSVVPVVPVVHGAPGRPWGPPRSATLRQSPSSSNGITKYLLDQLLRRC